MEEHGWQLRHREWGLYQGTLNGFSYWSEKRHPVNFILLDIDAVKFPTFEMAQSFAHLFGYACRDRFVVERYVQRQAA